MIAQRGTDERSWKCRAILNEDAIDPNWYTPDFDDTNWAFAVEHDLRCSNGLYYAYEGTLDRTTAGVPCVEWAGRDGVQASSRNYYRVPPGNPFGDLSAWCYISVRTARQCTCLPHWIFTM